MGWLDALTRKPVAKKKAAPKTSTATATRSASQSGYKLAPKFPQAHTSGARRAGTPITSTAKQGNALLGNTDSQIDRRLVSSGRDVDPVTAAYHSPRGTSTDPTGGSGAGWGSGGGGGQSAASLKAEQDAAAARLRDLATYNTQTATGQLDRQLAIYDTADSQNRQLAGVEKKQHSADTADDRFLRMKNVQASAHGIYGNAGNAMEGSARDTTGRMINTRNDMDTTESLTALRSNWNAVENALAESLNANVLARRGAISDTERALRTIRADTSAQLGNIDQKYFVAPDKLGGKIGTLPSKSRYRPKEYKAQLAGYIR